MYSHTHEYVEEKTASKTHKMSNDHKSKFCGAGLQAKVVKCGISAPGRSEGVS